MDIDRAFFFVLFAFLWTETKAHLALLGSQSELWVRFILPTGTASVTIIDKYKPSKEVGIA